MTRTVEAARHADLVRKLEWKLSLEPRQGKEKTLAPAPPGTSSCIPLAPSRSNPQLQSSNRVVFAEARREMAGKGGKGLIAGKTSVAYAKNNKDKNLPISRSTRAGLQFPDSGGTRAGRERE